MKMEKPEAALAEGSYFGALEIHLSAWSARTADAPTFATGTLTWRIQSKRLMKR